MISSGATTISFMAPTLADHWGWRFVNLRFLIDESLSIRDCRWSNDATCFQSRITNQQAKTIQQSLIIESTLTGLAYGQWRPTGLYLTPRGAGARRPRGAGGG